MKIYYLIRKYNFFLMMGLTAFYLSSCGDDDSSKNTTAEPIAAFSYQTGTTSSDYFKASFIDESTGGKAVAWTWDFGVPNIQTDISTEQNPNYDFPESDGVYKVTLRVTNDEGEEDEITKEIIIAQEIDHPIADFSFAGGTSSSTYQTVTFTDESTGGTAVKWEWDFGIADIDTDVSTEQNPVFDFPSSGKYVVTLTTYNAHNESHEITKEVEVIEIQFSTIEELEAVVDWNFKILAHENLYGRKLTLALMIRSDMVAIGDPSTASYRKACDGMRMGEDNLLVDIFWPKGYYLIDSVNTIINDGGKNVTGSSQEKINEVVAEARFLRGLMHYHFVRLFGKIPLTLTAPAGQEDTFVVTESSVDEVYASIIADFTFAKTWLPSMLSNKTRPSQGTASGFLASVYLTRGDWQNAYDEAKNVIDNGGYNLESDFANLFGQTDGGSEILFEMNNTGNDANGISGELGGSLISTDQITAVTGPRGDERFENTYNTSFGWSVLVPSIKVYNTWPNDYRKAVSLDTVITYLGDEDYDFTQWGNISQNVARPHIAKYFRATALTGAPAGPNFRDSETNYVAMRYAEVLLIAAEAALELGNASEAMGYVNQIRARARAADGTPRTVPADWTIADVTLENILEERRLELAFEFKRWYDIIRRDLMSESFGPNGLETQAWEAKDYLFPKYQRDVDLYPGLNQNTGY
ncbi:RagB/SusD family nutrient uptake outer membrane protein [Reichenbachiella agarivorans]|uniref:RagB/SusD family nutrient uptake outer membrane protein n=1 Tax=Reichenbachiella agarivorans TaxID=2979464 RepID=A0ABY6CXJ6_9BACT|nr:RagB/SusD family nutrient uptake outer membrane protein [Reichenbachiella agarivorans]UXP34123.1 RagB/SusD family nutrient uptake outer membrane protein [Reichenbachiella agarivorans]